MKRFGKNKADADETAEVDPLFGTTTPVPEPEQADEVEKVKKPKGKKNDPANFTWDSPVRPSAFLLPNYLTSRRALARAKKQTARLVVYGLIVLVALCVGSFILRLAADTTLKDKESDSAAQKKELASLSEASAFFTGLDLREQTVRETLVADVDYSKVIGAINDALPPGGALGTLTTAYGTSCPGPDPFVEVTSIGCVTFDVTVKSAADVETFITRANSNEAGNVVSFLALSASGGDDGNFGIQATANFTANTFTYRFTDKEEVPAGAPVDPTTGAPVPAAAGAAPGTAVPPKTPTQGAAQ
jgi:hypothetical protein